MKFGQRKADAPDEPSGDGMYLRAFKDGDTKVRFLQETDDWIVFREHYNKDRRAFPCTEDKNTCPGCISEDEDVQRSTRKYATLLQVHKGNYVAPFRVPMSLARRMFSRAERNDGVITDRDYVIMRSGKGLETDYDVDPDDKYEVNVKTLVKDAPSISEILERMFEDNAPGVAAPKAKARPEKEVASEEEELPSKAEPQSESAGDSVIEIDEDELYEMGIPALTDLAVKMDLDLDGEEKKSDLIRKILKAS
jgi:hypothetical protein